MTAPHPHGDRRRPIHAPSSLLPPPAPPGPCQAGFLFRDTGLKGRLERDGMTFEVDHEDAQPAAAAAV
jgi:hypothetical protein